MGKSASQCSPGRSVPFCDVVGSHAADRSKTPRNVNVPVGSQRHGQHTRTYSQYSGRDALPLVSIEISDAVCEYLRVDCQRVIICMCEPAAYEHLPAPPEFHFLDKIIEPIIHHLPFPVHTLDHIVHLSFP